jgi:hypothetical protein
MPGVSVTTTEIAVAAVALAALSLVLFVLAIRRLLARQAEVTVTMLRRYDERLATFAQTLNDALAAFQAQPALGTPDLADDPEPMMRTLELARERTRADGAIALVTGGNGTPIVATVGLSESETNHIARMGFPDYRGGRSRLRSRATCPRRRGRRRSARASSCLCSTRARHRASSACSPGRRAGTSARRTSTRSTASSGWRGPRSPVR